MKTAKEIVIFAIEKVLDSEELPPKLCGDLELYQNLFIDSRQFVTIILCIEQELGNVIDDELLLDANIVTVNDLVKLVEFYLKNEKNI